MCCAPPVLNTFNCLARYRLDGCVKDIENWGEFFGRRQVHFSMHVVCSDQNTSITATQKLGGCRDDILAGMKLVSDAMARSVAAQKFLFFNFSGHGTQVHDDDGDEADGLDEALCPCDFETAGVIVDDDLCRWLETLPSHQLFAVCDCCHSGTCLDLGEFSGFFGSGCRDDQVSADATTSGNASGAFTASLLHALSFGDCSPSDAAARVHDALLQAGIVQEPVLQCTTSSVLDGWGFDVPPTAAHGLKLEATGMVRAVGQTQSQSSDQPALPTNQIEAIRSENEIRLKSIQSAHELVVASLEEQHAAVIASMRSELNAAESAAKAEQQHREELQRQKQLFEHQIATLQASVLGLQQVMLTVLPVLLGRYGCISV